MWVTRLRTGECEVLLHVIPSYLMRQCCQFASRLGVHMHVSCSVCEACAIAMEWCWAHPCSGSPWARLPDIDFRPWRQLLWLCKPEWCCARQAVGAVLKLPPCFHSSSICCASACQLMHSFDTLDVSPHLAFQISQAWVWCSRHGHAWHCKTWVAFYTRLTHTWLQQSQNQCGGLEWAPSRCAPWANA